MLISEIDGVEFAPEHPELVGKRVLITGLKGALGLEIARVFAAARTRLVLHTAADDPEAVALGEIAAAEAMDVRLFADSFADYDSMLKFARTAVTCFGGIDAVINIAHLGEAQNPGNGSEAAIEQTVTNLLAMPCLVSKVAANRMRTTLTEGAILNILADERDPAPRMRGVAGLARCLLSGLTRTEAQAGASAGVRVNAIAPGERLGGGGPVVSGAPDVATLACHLVSPRGHQLSGLTFEAYFG